MKMEQPNANVSRKKPKPDAVQDGTQQRRRLHMAELLLEVSHKMAEFDTLDEVLNALVDMTTARLNAERGTLFLNDPESNELYSRVAQGNIQREIRLLNSSGIAGFVFTTGEPLIIHDAYSDPRFNRSIDEQTGFVTQNILCVPIKTVKGEVIGVAETINKRKGKFNRHDLHLLEAMTGEATRMLNAERSTLFLNDEKTNQLWSEVGQGLESMQIRLPNHVGIAGAVFTSGKSINIPYAYADLRFNPAFDKQTGFFTRSILCVPIVNKHGKTIGVTQVLNRHGGPFTGDDESRLRAFTAQISIALENAKLFADVQAMKNYNEAMLESMSNGLITLDENERIATCNAAGLRILKARAEEVLHKPVAEFFTDGNAWVLEKLRQVAESGQQQTSMDAPLQVAGETLSVNLTVQPLLNADQKRIGSMFVIEDISSEKRIKSTMARYMDPGIADRMVAAGAEVLGGKNVECTVLFSDIRGFTTLTEQLGAQGTVALLNEYFTLMVECIQREEGMLDKFIGDAIMAAFGIPEGHADDADRAVRAAIAMIRTLGEWNKQRQAHGMLPVNIGVGMNTDNVVSGNIGSKKRMDFTIIGDGVHLASRLESACKQYGTHILVSESTYKRLRGTYQARELDLVVVKGKTQPVAIYEILDYHTDETYPSLIDALGHFRNALTKYRQRKWQDATRLLNEVLALNPDDKPARLYIERCRYFTDNPPGDDWDGVWVMESK